jgi:hypothetical protein
MHFKKKPIAGLDDLQGSLWKGAENKIKMLKKNIWI